MLKPRWKIPCYWRQESPNPRESSQHSPSFSSSSCPVWDIAKRRIRYVFDRYSQEIYSLDFSHDGRLIISVLAIAQHVFGICKMEATNCLQTATTETADSGVTSVAISPNGRLVAAGSLDNTVRIWELTLMLVRVEKWRRSASTRQTSGHGYVFRKLMGTQGVSEHL